MTAVSKFNPLVRCNISVATPYLRAVMPEVLGLLGDKYIVPVVDLGAGSGRNMEYVAHQVGDKAAMFGFDLKPSHPDVKPLHLGVDDIPIVDKCADIVLCNYLLMFLDWEERSKLYIEIDRISSPGCSMVIELYPAKSGHFPDSESLIILANEVRQFFESKGWKPLDSNLKFHFTYRKNENQENK